jgi:hypothetical protein
VNFALKAQHLACYSFVKTRVQTKVFSGTYCIRCVGRVVFDRYSNYIAGG